jgi:hypothetical protein
MVVLAGGEHVQPDLFCLQGDLHDRLDPLTLGRRTSGRGVHGHITDAEDSELHLDPPGSESN